jgi:hypothetical protein
MYVCEHEQRLNYSLTLFNPFKSNRPPKIIQFSRIAFHFSIVISTAATSKQSENEQKIDTV